jgi:hypothetical protein
MSIESILSEIDAEIARLTQIRTLLSAGGAGAKGASESKATKTSAVVKGKKPRVLSPEARKRIADAQRKRWAAQKAKSK